MGEIEKGEAKMEVQADTGVDVEREEKKAGRKKATEWEGWKREEEDSNEEPIYRIQAITNSINVNSNVDTPEAMPNREIVESRRRDKEEEEEEKKISERKIGKRKMTRWS